MPAPRPRFRDLGLHIGLQSPGEHNAITDVPGVRVGHVTRVEGEGPLVIGRGPVRTGVTAILPPGEDLYTHPVEAGCFVFNGAGTTAGLSLIDEFGRIETPICLTNTLSVGSVYEGIVRHMIERIFKPRGEVPWFNPVVGETADGFLNDMGGLHVRPEHAVQAIEAAVGGPVQQGAVGAGTGTGCFGYKGGIGTASRRISLQGETAAVGVLVQSNFGGRLTICGIPMDPLYRPTETGASVMIIVATDLPLDNRMLNRLSRHAAFGLARTGSSGGHTSGDYVIAFSTTYRSPGRMEPVRRMLADNESHLDEAFIAAADATEEAIMDSMFCAHTVTGRDGNVREALPVDRVLEHLSAHGIPHSSTSSTSSTSPTS